MDGEKGKMGMSMEDYGHARIHGETGHTYHKGSKLEGHTHSDSHTGKNHDADEYHHSHGGSHGSEIDNSYHEIGEGDVCYGSDKKPGKNTGSTGKSVSKGGME